MATITRTNHDLFTVTTVSMTMTFEGVDCTLRTADPERNLYLYGDSDGTVIRVVTPSGVESYDDIRDAMARVWAA